MLVASRLDLSLTLATAARLPIAVAAVGLEDASEPIQDECN
jgi:hypothetical protein